MAESKLKRPSLLDLTIAAALTTWAVVEALVLSGEGSNAQRAAWALAFTVPLAFRRQFPVGVALLIAAVVASRALIADGGTPEEGAMPLPAVLFAAFTVAAHARTVPLSVVGLGGIGGALATVVFLSYWEGTAEPSDGAILVFFVLAAWGAGFFVRRRGAIAAQQAVLEERARIARELHDIIGHSVSVISLQAGAAEQLLRKDPDRAGTHLKAVRETAHEALVEMRRLMGVLKEDDAQYAPQPGLAMVGDLVEQSGMDVTLTQHGDPRPLAPGVDLAAYRVVQEALTNARKHGDGRRASVHVRYADDAVELEVVNQRGTRASPNSGGQGLVGMAERVRLFGGTLDAALHGTVFVVRARLPA